MTPRNCASRAFRSVSVIGSGPLGKLVIGLVPVGSKTPTVTIGGRINTFATACGWTVKTSLLGWAMVNWLLSTAARLNIGGECSAACSLYGPVGAVMLRLLKMAMPLDVACVVVPASVPLVGELGEIEMSKLSVWFPAMLPNESTRATCTPLGLSITAPGTVSVGCTT